MFRAMAMAGRRAGGPGAHGSFVSSWNSFVSRTSAGFSAAITIAGHYRAGVPEICREIVSEGSVARGSTPLRSPCSLANTPGGVEDALE